LSVVMWFAYASRESILYSFEYRAHTVIINHCVSLTMEEEITTCLHHIWRLCVLFLRVHLPHFVYIAMNLNVPHGKVFLTS
jgi:hypothetical protein